ncbi:RNA-binding protein [Penicillium cosmopolitanum]|uniref:RNA-binding protein n=1 Tax=Penicillium cosmopolitanum TaxID=1131564 RepID=A0A9W9VQH6_9EURO|nr:RNA-binding protein [Penicillium cosmopolitanum]KAJ5387314.1 RNA-binding protein [Penicillium cosmopolitanum]
MAEPEDLEEDLFADLYDADESTTRTTSAVEASKPVEPVAAAVPPPAEEPAAAPVSAVPTYDSSAPDSYPSYQAPQQDYNAGYQNGSQASAPPAQAPHADHEPHGSGTGIKEDG